MQTLQFPFPGVHFQRQNFPHLRLLPQSKFREVDFLQSLILLGKRLICQFVIVAGDKSHMSYAVIFKMVMIFACSGLASTVMVADSLLFFILRGFLGIIHIDAV